MITLELVITEYYSAFRRTIKRVGIDLAGGQLSHVMRDAFASYNIMSGRVFWCLRASSLISILSSHCTQAY